VVILNWMTPRVLLVQLVHRMDTAEAADHSAAKAQ
jgi:hypothetical protein